LPTFSIILPVRNGGEYVKDCIASILAQSNPDFELLILDNNSNDGTSEWLASLIDQRISVNRSETNLSIEENWGRILTAKKNEYMTMIGHDDLLERDYLATMSGLIAQHPDATLFQTHFNYIDNKTKFIRACKTMPPALTASAFLERVLENRIDIMGTGFMMRSKDYDNFKGIPAYPNLLFADFELWLSLIGKGYLAVSPKTCFSFRIHQSTTSVSADIKFNDAFDRFISFLEKLSASDAECAAVIREKGRDFLLFYCRGLSHRLLRTELEKRQGLLVRDIIKRFKVYAQRLKIDPFSPEKIWSIRLGKFIDRYSLTRGAFLTFKKIFRKPIIR